MVHANGFTPSQPLGPCPLAVVAGSAASSSAATSNARMNRSISPGLSLGSTSMGIVERELSRRDFLERTATLGVGAMVLAALPVAERMIAADPAIAALLPDDATLQAFADTILPGRKATKTDLGDEIDPLAIAGVDGEPGAVEADALRLYHDPLIGFDALAPPFLSDLSGRALQQGGVFLTLPYDKRAAAVMSGLSFDNPSRVLW